MLGTILRCYGLIQNVAASRGHEVERNTSMEQSIKTTLYETEVELTKAESTLEEYHENYSQVADSRGHLKEA